MIRRACCCRKVLVAALAVLFATSTVLMAGVPALARPGDPVRCATSTAELDTCIPLDSPPPQSSGAISIGTPVLRRSPPDDRYIAPVTLPVMPAYTGCRGSAGELCQYRREVQVSSWRPAQHDFVGDGNAGVSLCYADSPPPCTADNALLGLSTYNDGTRDDLIVPGLFVIELTTFAFYVGDPQVRIYREYAELDTRGPSVDPTAAFTAAPDTTRPGRVTFTSTSSDPSGVVPFDSWTFGDGTTGTGRFLTHDYTRPGRFTVTLTSRNQSGATASVSHEVEIAAPRLSADVELIDAAPPLKPGQQVTARVTVRASTDGVGPLTGLRFSAGAALSIAPASAFDVVSGPDPAPPSSGFTLGAGEARTSTYRLKASAVRVPAYTLTTSVTGKDGAGAPVSATATDRGEIGQPFASTVRFVDDEGKSVDEITLDDDGRGGQKPQDLNAITSVTNDTGSVLRSVQVQPMDLRTLSGVTGNTLVPAAVVGPNDAVDVGTVAPGESREVRRTIRLSVDGVIRASSTVSAGDELSLASADLKVGAKTLLRVSIDGAAQRTVVAGRPVVLTGTVENVSHNRTVALTDPVRVTTDGNGYGLGYLARDTGVSFPAPLVGQLAPGEKIPFRVTLGTVRPTVGDYADGTENAARNSSLLVGFPTTYRAAVKEDDGTWSALSTSPVAVAPAHPSSIRVVGPAAVSVTIDTAPLDAASVLERQAALGFGLTEGALEGASTRALNVLGFAYRFTTDPQFRDHSFEQAWQDDAWQTTLRMLSDVAVYLPEQIAGQLVHEVGRTVYDGLRTSVTEVGGGRHVASPSEAAIRDLVTQYVTRLQGAWNAGDTNELVEAVRPIGLAAGAAATDVAATELAFQGFVRLATSSRYLAPAIANWRSMRTVADMKARLPAAAQQAVELGAVELSKSTFPALEQSFLTRSPLSDVQLGVGANNDGAGLARQTIAKARQWTADNPNKVMVVIPNEANVAAVRDSGQAVGKAEVIKPKSLADIEYAVFGGRAEDRNIVVLRDLDDISTARADELVDRAIAAGAATEEDRAVALQILDKRKKEWALFTNRGAVKKVDGRYVADIDPATGRIRRDDLGIGDLKGYDEAGFIPTQFRGVDNGLTVSGPRQTPKFGLEYYDGAYRPTAPDTAVYVVPRQQSPTTGRLVKITGDDDGIFLGSLNGLGLGKDEIDAAYASLTDVFNHPFSDTWLAKINKKLEIFSRYFETVPGTDVAGQPLVMFANGQAYAVKIGAEATRFDTVANRAFVDFIGAPRAVDPLAARTAYRAVSLDTVAASVLSARFIRMFLREAGTAFGGRPILITTGGKIVRIVEGHLQSWTLSGGWVTDPAAERAAASGRLSLAPQTTLTTSTPRGAERVELVGQRDSDMTGDWFQAGDRVAFDPGGPNQETADVRAIGSLIFATGLRRPHRPGEVVVDLGPVGGRRATPPVASPPDGPSSGGAASRANGTPPARTGPAIGVRIALLWVVALLGAGSALTVGARRRPTQLSVAASTAATACARVCTPSLRKICSRWRRTVDGWMSS